MAWRVYYHEDVSFDIKEAKEWYNFQKLGLDKKFALAVKRAILRLQENPFHYQLRHKNIRAILTEIFPYAVHFYVEEEKKQIVIIAVLHQHQSPMYVSKRI